jgi:hypothetical protein
MPTRLFRTDAFRNMAAAFVLAGCVAAGTSLTSVAAPVQTEAPRALRAGDILSGELTAMRSGPRKKRTVTYQLTSTPRRLPPPAGLCNLETGPETFQIVTRSDAEAKALKPFIGKTVSIRAKEVSCAQAAGEWSDAIVSDWSVVTQH